MDCLSAHSVACPTAHRTDHSSAYLSFPLLGGLPDASLDGLLVGSLVPSVRRQLAQRIACRHRSSACPTDGLSPRSRRVLMAVAGKYYGLQSPFVGFCWWSVTEFFLAGLPSRCVFAFSSFQVFEFLVSGVQGSQISIT
jgi:hypothetical protein